MFQILVKFIYFYFILSFYIILYILLYHYWKDIYVVQILQRLE